jgi:cytoskeletal protein CcmA (bactofilin family)
MKKIIALILVFMLAGPLAQAQGVIHLEDSKGDNYLWGEELKLFGKSKGDVLAIGRSIEVLEGYVDGDILAAAERLILEGPVSDDAYLLGEEVVINQSISGDVIAVGKEVTVAKSSKISANAKLVGETVNLAGHVIGDVRIVAKYAYVSGIVEGQLTVDAESLIVKKDARVQGGVIYNGPTKAVVDDRAQIELKENADEAHPYILKKHRRG